SVAGVIPNRIKPSIRRYGKCAKPVPFVRVNRIVVYLHWRTKCCSVIGAAYKHYISGASPGWHHAGQHVNVVVSGGAGMVDRQKQLSPQSVWIDSPETTDEATHVNLRDLVKSRCHAAVLSVARPYAIKRAESLPANKEVAIGVHVECAGGRLVRNIDRRLPGHATVGGALELYAAAAAVSAV